MHVSIVELLRCPAGHAESPLVAAAAKQRERRILHGTLGCPVCGRTYPIVGGIADFRAQVHPASPEPPGDEPNDAAAVRLAAQCDLTEHNRLVLLAGHYARLAPALTVMFDARCIALNVPPDAERHVAAEASVLRVDHVIPLAAATLHAAAVDATHAARLGLAALHVLLRRRGRLIAPSSAAVPAGVQVLARDDLEWVGERSVEIVQLGRATR